MLSGLKKKEQLHSVEDKNPTTESPTDFNHDSLRETPDDEITVGSNHFLSHQERYKYLKNRTYLKSKKSIRVADF